LSRSFNPAGNLFTKHERRGVLFFYTQWPPACASLRAVVRSPALLQTPRDLQHCSRSKQEALAISPSILLVTMTLERSKWWWRGAMLEEEDPRDDGLSEAIMRMGLIATHETELHRPRVQHVRPGHCHEDRHRPAQTPSPSAAHPISCALPPPPHPPARPAPRVGLRLVLPAAPVTSA